MDAARAAPGHGWPMAAGPRSVAGVRVRRRRSRQTRSWTLGYLVSFQVTRRRRNSLDVRTNPTISVTPSSGNAHHTSSLLANAAGCPTHLSIQHDRIRRNAAQTKLARRIPLRRIKRDPASGFRSTRNPPVRAAGARAFHPGRRGCRVQSRAPAHPAAGRFHRSQTGLPVRCQSHPARRRCS